MTINTLSRNRAAKSKSGFNFLHALPLAMPDTNPERDPPMSPSEPGRDRVNILIVDDTPENLIALEAVLSDLGQNILKARSGEEALRILLKESVAAILLDVNMPGLNGFETAALIRQRRNSEHTPIIFVSAISTTEMHMYKGYALGAVDYIFTPVVAEVLRSKVSVFVELSKKTEEIRQQADRIRQIEEREYRRRISEAAERIELETKRNRFFNLSIDMLAIADFSGYFRQLNPTWRATLGFTEEELAARPLVEFVHPEDRSGTLRKIEELKTSDTPGSFENRYLCANGGYRWLSWTAAPFSAEQLIYFFSRDITEQKEAEEKIRKLNEDLERRALLLSKTNAELETEIVVRKRAEQALKETNAELESFSYSVSHDLRAPLRAMQSFAEALLADCGDELSEMGREFAQRIVAAANRMDMLIQDLLVYSRISHNDVQLLAVPLDILLDECLVQLQIPIQDTNATVQLHKPLLTVQAHHSTLLQVVCNLVSNAIKFVPPHVKPVVKISSERIDGCVRLSVTDNGIGIDPEHHSRIFRVFERLHGIESYPGTGIGLAIVRKGVERMGGHVGLDSVADRGSRFWIELPEAAALNPQRAP